jgi:hypothetical protein
MQSVLWKRGRYYGSANRGGSNISIYGENRLFVAKQFGHATPEMTLCRYVCFSRRVPRMGMLANRFTTDL